MKASFYFSQCESINLNMPHTHFKESSVRRVSSIHALNIYQFHQILRKRIESIFVSLSDLNRIGFLLYIYSELTKMILY